MESFGCGCIREYQPVITKTLTLDQCLKAVEDSGAPIVSFAGGEPTIYSQIPELIEELVRRKIFVYCCTNGLLLERAMKRIPPSKYLAWITYRRVCRSVHLGPPPCTETSTIFELWLGGLGRPK